MLLSVLQLNDCVLLQRGKQASKETPDFALAGEPVKSNCQSSL